MADLQSAAARTQPAARPITSDEGLVRLDRALTKPALEIDADLARVLEAWPALADPIKAAILAIVASATTLSTR